MVRRSYTRFEDGERLPMLVWRFAEPLLLASTAAVGGGIGLRDWVVNAQVGHGYARRDQAQHGAELAAVARLDGSGVVMFTAAEVANSQQAFEDGARVEATVGLGHPTWAADADDASCEPAPPAGTINIVAVLPVRLCAAAQLNALCTLTEAKTQALLAAGIPGTGTASDAVSLICPAHGPAEPFGGPRSTWGARLARACHRSVLAGARQSP